MHVAWCSLPPMTILTLTIHGMKLAKEKKARVKRERTFGGAATKALSEYSGRK